MTVPTMPDDVAEFCNAVGKAYGLYPQVIFAWIVAEDNSQREKIKDDFNPLNIRYLYEDQKPWTSSTPYFHEANGIKANGVMTYPDLATGIRAVIALLQAHYYIAIRGTAGKSPREQAMAIQQSPWDAGHYNMSDSDPGTIIRILQGWGFVNIPKKEIEEKANDTHIAIAEAGKAATDALGKIWALEEYDNEKETVHMIAQLLRNHLVSNGYATWTDDKMSVSYTDGKTTVVV